MMRTLAIGAAGLAILYVAIVALLFFFQSRVVHQPGSRELISDPEDIGLDYEAVHITTADDVRIHGWLIPASGPRRGVLLFFHGNAGNISHRLDSIRIFHELGLDTLIIDYRGYGQSEGRPSEQGLYADAKAARAYLRERGYDDREIVYFGRSLGGAVATDLAATIAPAALILESTFTSIPDVAADAYPVFPVRLLARLEYPARNNLQDVRAPVLVIHSRDDELIDFDHGKALYEAAPGPKRFLEIEGDHNSGFLQSRARYTETLDDFLTEYLGPANEAESRQGGAAR